MDMGETSIDIGAPRTQQALHSDDGVDRAPKGSFCRNKGCIFVFVAVVAALILGLVFYPIYMLSVDDGKHPEYSVTVAGFSGLEPDHDLSRATLDRTFDLTVHIKEPRRWSGTECVERGTVASVSYRGVALARGPVPEFCGRSKNTTEVSSVMAWGNAVTVPEFALDRLAEELRRGEATVHVTLTAPARFCWLCLQKVVDCDARMGHGEASPGCSISYQNPTFPDDADKIPRARRLLTL